MDVETPRRLGIRARHDWLQLDLKKSSIGLSNDAPMTC